jgi:flagellar basal-body rod modification protein FlgD
MGQVPSLLNTPPSNQVGGDYTAFNDLDLGVFLKLLITELQNQDPLNPLENSEMLAQINQIREVGATDKLTSTLESVLLGQNIASSTNLIGADINAVSDDNRTVNGTVTRVSIEGGKPKLHLDLALSAEPSIEKGDVAKGEYGYRILWADERGGLQGIELAGADAVSTQGGNDYQSIILSNLPITAGAKQIYRTDKSGAGDYQLVAVLTDGGQSSYRDTTADDARSETRQTEPFQPVPRETIRSFKVSLSNVAEIRAPRP